jgi:hypothetical protein
VGNGFDDPGMGTMGLIESEKRGDELPKRLLQGADPLRSRVKGSSSQIRS